MTERTWLAREGNAIAHAYAQAVPGGNCSSACGLVDHVLDLRAGDQDGKQRCKTCERIVASVQTRQNDGG